MSPDMLARKYISMIYSLQEYVPTHASWEIYFNDMQPPRTCPQTCQLEDTFQWYITSKDMSPDMLAGKYTSMICSLQGYVPRHASWEIHFNGIQPPRICPQTCLLEDKLQWYAASKDMPRDMLAGTYISMICSLQGYVPRHASWEVHFNDNYTASKDMSPDMLAGTYISMIYSFQGYVPRHASWDIYFNDIQPPRICPETC